MPMPDPSTHLLAPSERGLRRVDAVVPAVVEPPAFTLTRPTSQVFPSEIAMDASTAATVSRARCRRPSGRWEVHRRRWRAGGRRAPPRPANVRRRTFGRHTPKLAVFSLVEMLATALSAGGRNRPLRTPTPGCRGRRREGWRRAEVKRRQGWRTTTCFSTAAWWHKPKTAHSRPGPRRHSTLTSSSVLVGSQPDHVMSPTRSTLHAVAAALLAATSAHPLGHLSPFIAAGRLAHEIFALESAGLPTAAASR